MANEPAAPAAPAPDSKAAAPVTPAAPAAPAAPATPAAPAAPPAAAPAAPAPGAKQPDGSLLDAAKADGKATVSPVVAAHDAAITAVEAWQKNPTPETKAAAEKAVADAKAAVETAKTASASAGAPEKYEFKAPEGVTLDQAALDAAAPVFKELGLTNDQANKLVALQASLAANQEKADLKLWEDSQAKQKEEAIKGLGPKWQEELAFAAVARDRFFSKEAVQALNFAGVANNIHILRAFITMGRQISPEKLVDGTPAQSEKQSDATKLYPSMAGAK